ncbi:MAG: YARHG domain-containing protein [Acidobacteriota bacterium]|nr:YARHG domain-containing protein [Acidobacteriota bacterium]
MRKRLVFLLLLTLTVCASVFAQDEEYEAEKKKRWQQFSKQNWDKIDYAKKKITKAQLVKLSSDGVVDELALLRGVVFGKRGRVFKELSIQDYLEKQVWYKPKVTFTNAVLTKIERDNLDAIRLAEAERHDSVQPGDLRLWQTREIPDDKIYAASASDWRILIAEVEAIHGKRFDDEPWLQKYFEERYWYRANANYSPTILNEFERKNLEKFNSKRDADRAVGLSVGDMDKFQNALLPEELLKNLSMNDLRMIRNEFWARHGRKFTTHGFKQMFEWRDWYKPAKDQSKIKLNAIEEQNVKLIEREEAKLREKISTEPITNTMIDGLFVEDLRVLRNEIYAKRGRIFKDPNLQKYFAAQPWYQPNPDFKDESLTETESKNLAIIKEVEEYSISKFSEAEG